MSKRCAKCTKTVYPTEELKCLDKIWHKACFKCEVCGMTLNMKNYKGYDKLPYCNAHYPTTKHTQVADTPESRRIAENTKIQSQIQYHEDFEKSKGKIHQVTDTLEMQTHAKNTKNFSLLNYHRDFEKEKDKFTTVTDPVLLKNQMKVTKAVSLHDYHKDFERSKDKFTAVANPLLVRNQVEVTKKVSMKEYHSDYDHCKGKYTPVADPADVQQHLLNQKKASVVEYKKDFERDKSKFTTVTDTVEMRTHQKNKMNRQQGKPRKPQKPPKPSKPAMLSEDWVQYHADFEKQKGFKTSVAEDPETARIKQNTAIQSNINYWGIREQRTAMEEKRPMDAVDDSRSRRTSSSKSSHVNPGVEQYSSPYSGKSHSSVVYDSQSRQVSNPGRRQPGSIADYDPMTQQFGSSYPDPRQGGGGGGYPGYQQQQQQQPVRHPQPYQPHQPQPYRPPGPQPQTQRSRGMVCKAMYDYSAADSDEVSFMDGDIIIDCQPVDAGWMMGRVDRTGQYGMLPSNYVERIN